MPGRHQRDAQGVCDPKTQDPDIARRGDVQNMRSKRQNLRRQPILISAQKGIAGQIMVQRKCRRTSFDFHLREGRLTDDLGSRPAMNTQERKLPAAGKCGELPAERTYSVGLVKAIGEERHTNRRYQQVFSKPKVAGNCFARRPFASPRFSSCRTPVRAACNDQAYVRGAGRRENRWLFAGFVHGLLTIIHCRPDGPLRGG